MGKHFKFNMIDGDIVSNEEYEKYIIAKGYVTKDSGERKEYKSGMHRDLDKGKPRYDLIYQPMLKRWAELMARGADKYGDNNWMKANSEEELKRFKASAYRHFYDWLNNENTDEDHSAAIMFNVAAVEYLKEKLKDGR